MIEKTDAEKSLQIYWRAFVFIGLIFVYCMVINISSDAEKAHGKMRHDVDVLQQIKKATDMGHRSTYCDMIRHMVYEHGADPKLLDECMDKPITGLEKLFYQEVIE